MTPRTPPGAARAAGAAAAASLALAASGCAASESLQVASSYTSLTLCSAAFVSRVDPARVYADAVASSPGFGFIRPFVRFTIDRARGEATTTIVGGFGSRAVLRPGLGCMLVHGDVPVAGLPAAPSPEPRRPALLPPIAGPRVVVPASPGLRAAVERAFAERSRPPYLRTLAVVVVHDGRIVAERYAAGVGPGTPLLGNSATKSVLSALVGILVRDGRLAVGAPAPVSAWRAPGDPRRRITVAELLRQTSGLALDETGSPLDATSRMLMLASDTARFAESAPLSARPGTRWRYASGNYAILSRLVRDAAGGTAPAVLRFARRELFDPLGMRDVTLECDETGTPLGSAFLYASARDWARFGMLYLDDGVVGGRRILPRGWVAYSAAATTGAAFGYGAGFWTNRAPGSAPAARIRLGMPRDAFFANGRLGQFVVIAPSERLVVVRLGFTQEAPFGDVESVARLVGDVVAALHRRGR